MVSPIFMDFVNLIGDHIPPLAFLEIVNLIGDHILLLELMLLDNLFNLYHAAHALLSINHP